MITYNGTPMLSRKDFIECADKLDPAFADALNEYMGDYEAICDENDYYYQENQKLEKENEELMQQIIVLETQDTDEQRTQLEKQNKLLEAQITEMQQNWNIVYDMLKNTKGIESIIKARLAKALDFMKRKGVA